jgi:hypothetical protein
MKGLTVTEVRRMTEEEQAREGWDRSRHDPVVLVMEDGTTVYAARDPEGNGPGAMFGTDPDGELIHIVPADE